jgi:nucleotide-binding universal stress UspA family protein
MLTAGTEVVVMQRVVVGVEDTLAGLRALRVAVAEARRRGAALHALRAWTFTPSRSGGPGAWYDEMQKVAADKVVAAFDKAMGGLPRDVEVVSGTLVGPPGSALVDYAHRDDDLLVVGATRGNRLVRLLRASVPRYCVAWARCAVLVVPPDTFARQARRESLARAIRREFPTLAG